MTATPARARVRRLDARGAGRIRDLLLADFGAAPPSPGRRDGLLRHQQLLDALGRGEHDRFVVWPGDDPVGVLYLGPSGTIIPAGDHSAGEPLASAAERANWRVLIGDAPIARRLLEGGSRGLFRRRPHAREQRFMAALPGAPGVGGDLAEAGVRRAAPGDLDVLTDFACRLHVEDQMGPPIPAAGRGAVRARMLDSVNAGATWVAERDGEVVGKLDLALRSPEHGAQIAGVYVAEPARGRGVASAATAAVTGMLLDEGLPGVTLHVRADNAAAIAAYRRAGYVDLGSLMLALR